MADWHYSNGAERHGPISTDEMRQLVESGAVEPNDLVWKEGMPKWLPLHSQPELMPPLPVLEPMNPKPLSLWQRAKNLHSTLHLQGKWFPVENTNEQLDISGWSTVTRGNSLAGKIKLVDDQRIEITDNGKLLEVWTLLKANQLELVIRNSKGEIERYGKSPPKNPFAVVFSDNSGPIPQSHEKASTEHIATWEVPKSKKLPAFQIVNEAKTLIFEPWTFKPSEDQLESIVIWEPSLLRKMDRSLFNISNLGLPSLISGKDRISAGEFVVYFYDSDGVEIGNGYLDGSDEFVKSRKHKVTLSTYRGDIFAKVVIRDRDHKRR